MENIEKKYIDASYILENVWNGINWEGINRSRLMKINEEFANKVKAFSRTTSKITILVEKICRAFDSRVTTDEFLKIENEEEIMEVFREETQIPVLLLTIRREEKKKQFEEKQKQEKSKK